MKFKQLAAGLLLCATVFGRAAPSAEDEPKIRINLAGMDLATVVKQVERVTKRSFLYDETVLRSKRVTLQSDTPISPAEFYRTFQAICQMNGLALIPLEGAGIQLEKIVSAQGAYKEPGAQPVFVRGDALPGGETMVSYVIKLKYVSTAKVLPILTPSLSATGTILQIPNSDLMMINDVASSITRLEKLLTLLDVPGEPVTTICVKVRNVSVDKAQSLLNEYLQALAKAKTGEAVREKLNIVKDDRLGLLHIIGPQSDVTQAREFLVLVDADSPTTQRTVRYYKLKNVPVKEIVEYVGQLLGVALASRSSEKPVNAERSTASDAAQIPSFTPATIPTLAPAPNSQTTIVNGVVPPPTPAVTQSHSIRPLAKNGAPLPADIFPVEGLNTLVVSGDEIVHREVETILENLDRRKGQVLIEVAIIQVTGADNFDLGIEGLSLNPVGNNILDGGTGFNLGAQADTLKRGFPGDSTLSALNGGALRYVMKNRLQVVLTALASKSNVSIVSQPQLLVNDNEEASFTTKVSQPTSVTQSTAGNPNITSFGGFADATTSLKITPHISPDNYLNLSIVQTFEEFTGTSNTGIPPPKVSNNATTKVSIPDRQTIIIGGFTRDSSDNSKTGVPGLMNIPGIGKAFSHETKGKTISRLYLFVRPIILSAPDFADLNEATERKKDDIERRSKKSNIKSEINEGIGRNADIVPLDEAKR